MDIEEYDPPNILFLKGCFIDDCDSLEDIFVKKLMESTTNGDVSYEIKNQEYNKIPSVFKSLDTWPSKTNLKCWSCDCDFHTRPIFIPTTIYSNNDMDTEGNFCMWGCASRYINTFYNVDERWEKHAMLRELHEIFTGSFIEDIVPSPPKTEMVQYGGRKTKKEYRDHLMCLNETYRVSIQHNLIENLSPKTASDLYFNDEEICSNSIG